MQAMANVLGTSIEYLTGETENDLPTSYVVDKNSTAELFYMVDIYKKSSREDQVRLLEYFKKYEEKKSR